MFLFEELESCVWPLFNSKWFIKQIRLSDEGSSFLVRPYKELSLSSFGGETGVRDEDGMARELCERRTVWESGRVMTGDPS